MQKPDTEEIILKALYAEALMHGDFNEVTCSYLCVEHRDFCWALYVLQMRGLIEGCVFHALGGGMDADRQALRLTPRGFEKIESDDETDDAYGRLKSLHQFFRAGGVSRAAERIARWMQNPV